ncbi:MAG: transcription antitermination factor NusB [Chloroflexi bacterium]|nr:MAG: transcription antitermination factor NusB [Chloroflexota bacterium]
MIKAPLAVRRRGRAVALQALYEADCTGHDLDDSLNRLLEESTLPEETAKFTRDLVSQVVQHREAIDRLVQRFAPAWPLNQLSPIDRNILRLGVAELVSQMVPPKVAINEAVELAKAFGSSNSARFVNGVLGSVYDELTRDNSRKG